jgi:hypothetical protein
MMRSDFLSLFGGKGAPGFIRRAADGVPGEFAGGLRATVAGFKNFRSPRCFPILAALLFDLGIVDIRRVGTQTSEYSSWGVPRKKSVSRQAFAGRR